MYRHLSLSILLTIPILLNAIAYAQETEVYTNPEGYFTVTYPSSWTTVNTTQNNNEVISFFPTTDTWGPELSIELKDLTKEADYENWKSLWEEDEFDAILVLVGFPNDIPLSKSWGEYQVDGTDAGAVFTMTPNPKASKIAVVLPLTFENETIDNKRLIVKSLTYDEVNDEYLNTLLSGIKLTKTDNESQVDGDNNADEEEDDN